MNIANLWNELLVIGVVVYIIALIFVGITFWATQTRHLIIGGIVALFAGFLGQISKIAFMISAFLAIVRFVLNFI